MGTGWFTVVDRRWHWSLHGQSRWVEPYASDTRNAQVAGVGTAAVSPRTNRELLHRTNNMLAKRACSIASLSASAFVSQPRVGPHNADLRRRSRMRSIASRSIVNAARRETP